jgi:hypothetical protein
VSCCSYHRRQSYHLGIHGRIIEFGRIIELVKCGAVLQDGSIFIWQQLGLKSDDLLQLKLTNPCSNLKPDHEVVDRITISF